MTEKHPAWTRRRVGRNKVHWVAYDDKAGAEGRMIVDQGYAATLPEADAAARAALAEAGMYQARRTSTAFARPKPSGDQAKPGAGPTPGSTGPRHYLYTRRHFDVDGTAIACAHLVLRKTPKKVYVTQQSWWTGQVGTDDEQWDPNGRAIALDRLKLEQDGSVYSLRSRDSAFHRSPAAALGDAETVEDQAFARLGLRPPCTLDDIKIAYRRKALEVHPDRGGTPGDFQAVEDAYRQLTRAAQDPVG